MSAQAAPVPVKERIVTLDAIRGFALLGIFIMNMPSFVASGFSSADGTELWPEWWDRTAEIAREVLFSGKFNSIDRKSTRLNSSHSAKSRMPSSA